MFTVADGSMLYKCRVSFAFDDFALAVADITLAVMTLVAFEALAVLVLDV